MNASELKKQFRCYGHFYRLRVDGSDPLPCRSVLEITSLPRGAVDPAASDDLFSGASPERNLPDAVVIMMNPGSSRPLEPGDTDSLLDRPPEEPGSKPLVLTRPDNTQYQIMRVMVSQGWNHVRVLNLSDLREPKSPLFTARVEHLATLSGGDRHSLFSPVREREREGSLECKPNAPLILGWGQIPALIPLAEACLHTLNERRTIRVPSPVHPVLTAHPSPMLQSKKEEWIRTVTGLLH